MKQKKNLSNVAMFKTQFT